FMRKGAPESVKRQSLTHGETRGCAILALTGDFCHDAALRCRFHRGFAMKKSLPLIGLAMFAGLAASAQAATAVRRLHAQEPGAGAFAAALGYDTGLSSALGDLISGNPRQATADTTPACSCRHDAQAADRQSTPPLPPGPAAAAPMAARAAMPMPAD